MNIKKNNCRIIAVDNSELLMEECRNNSVPLNGGLPVECLCEDVCGTVIEKASVVVMNFILQFIDENKKDDLIKKIYSGLNKNGALFLSEKIKYDASDEDAFHVKYYHKFKKLQGYSDLEIEQKQKALKNVLKLDTIEQHIHRLKNAGFSKIYLWYQYFNFISIFAVK